MLSTLSVLTLLLAADGPSNTAPATPEFTALAVDVDFMCTPLKTQSLILPPKAEGQLEIPKPCPEAGADWRLSVGCASAEQCSGEISTPQGALARVEGSRKQLTVKALAARHPATLDLLRVRLTVGPADGYGRHEDGVDRVAGR